MKATQLMILHAWV